jgi:hypothetical protein
MPNFLSASFFGCKFGRAFYFRPNSLFSATRHMAQSRVPDGYRSSVVSVLPSIRIPSAPIYLSAEPGTCFLTSGRQSSGGYPSR